MLAVRAASPGMNVIRPAQCEAGGKHREEAERVRRQRSAVAETDNS